jgi:hypothetical protein
VTTPVLRVVLVRRFESASYSIYQLAGALGVSPGELYDGVAWIPEGEGGGEYRIDDRPEG